MVKLQCICQGVGYGSAQISVMKVLAATSLVLRGVGVGGGSISRKKRYVALGNSSRSNMIIRVFRNDDDDEA